MTYPLVGRGREADVYDIGNGRVLRRYRNDKTTANEATVMRYVREHGYPAPEVFEASGSDMVMERVSGPTMLADVGRRPHRVFAYARMLADLHTRMHAIPAGDLGPSLLGPGPNVVHLDLHPDNVVITEKGPVVIDWPNSGSGVPAAEVAHLWILLSTSTVPGTPVQRLVHLGRGILIRSFLKRFDMDAVRAHVPEAGAYRLRNQTLLPEELQRIEQFVEREAR